MSDKYFILLIDPAVSVSCFLKDNNPTISRFDLDYFPTFPDQPDGKR
jgi:hypothetical protein